MFIAHGVGKNPLAPEERNVPVPPDISLLRSLNANWDLGSINIGSLRD